MRNKKQTKQTKRNSTRQNKAAAKRATKHNTAAQRMRRALQEDLHTLAGRRDALLRASRAVSSSSSDDER